MGDVFKTLEVFSPSGQTVNIFSFGTDLLAQDGPSCKGQLRTRGSILVCSLESNNSGYELDFLYEHHYLPVKFWWETLGETFSFIKVFFSFIVNKIHWPFLLLFAHIAPYFLSLPFPQNCSWCHYSNRSKRKKIVLKI